MVDILILGATGVSGRQTALYLASHPQRALFSFGIAGRSKSKLDKLAAELNDSNISLFPVDVTNPEQIDGAVKQAKIIINTVGPYWTWGTPVIAACVKHNVHYVDLTGEPHWLRKIIIEFDYAANKSNTILVPSCGLDSIPSDFSVHLAKNTLLSSFPDQEIGLADSLTAFSVRGKLSGGTWASMMTALDVIPTLGSNLGKDYLLSPVSGKPSPKPKAIYQLEQSSLAGSFYSMQPSNRAVVHRSWGLLEMAGSKNRYGSSFTYDEFIVMPGRVAAAVFSCVFGIFMLGMAYVPPFRWLVKTIGPKSGPSDAEMRQGFFKTTNITTSATSPPIKVESTISAKGDPGYYLSPIMLAESALCIALSKDSLPELGKRGGILTPSVAFGNVLVDRLRETGIFKIESSIVGDDKKDV
ncbi:Saccharopine dehydrogenase-domain-containing protein [Mycena floridula]|nr:Saccharopine dehydrogenase-domain-containing protein [Mycena floridula]